MSDDKGHPRRPRVALAIPSYDGWKAEMGHDALNLAINSAPHVDLTTVFVHGQDTSEARNNIVAALRDMPDDQKVDAILWIDADMRFPPDALLRLLRHRLPLVGADYRLRKPPFPRIGLWYDPDNPFSHYYPPPPEAPKTGLDDRMAVLGFGLILTHMRLFEFPDWPRPWFARAWSNQNVRVDNPSGFITEDCVFCTMARAHGVKVVCDLDLSAEVSHIGGMQVPWNLPQTGTPT